MNSLTLSFPHHGQTRTLAKHPKVRHALKHGQITLDQARLRPWYLRLKIGAAEKTFKLKQLAKDKVIIEARDLLNSRLAQPNEFAAFLAQRDAARSVTLGQLAAEWIAAGYPMHSTKLRSPAAVANLSGFLATALSGGCGRESTANFGWSTKPVAGIAATDLQAYAARRAPALRSADLELNALSCLCSWAKLTGRIAANPFAKRARFAETRQHCHEASPPNDETLHRVIAWLFDTPVRNARTPDAQNIIVGAWLAFTALTGLRPGEPKFLQRLPPLAALTGSAGILPAGSIFPDRTGQLRMKVQREKRGQNPFVTITPALESFLSAWRAWLAANLSDVAAPRESAAKLFPLQTDDQTVLTRALNQASEALELPHFKPHGFGRAYYVKVRRSQGADDSTIAGELGQTTNGDLIRSVYGDPDDLHGGQLHDWLPDDTAPAWALLSQVNLAARRAQIEAAREFKRPRDTSRDTSARVQDSPNMTQDGCAKDSNPSPQQLIGQPLTPQMLANQPLA